MRENGAADGGGEERPHRSSSAMQGTPSQEAGDAGPGQAETEAAHRLTEDVMEKYSIEISLETADASE